MYAVDFHGRRGVLYIPLLFMHAIVFFMQMVTSSPAATAYPKSLQIAFLLPFLLNASRFTLLARPCEQLLHPPAILKQQTIPSPPTALLHKQRELSSARKSRFQPSSPAPMAPSSKTAFVSRNSRKLTSMSQNADSEFGTPKLASARKQRAFPQSQNARPAPLEWGISVLLMSTRSRSLAAPTTQHQSPRTSASLEFRLLHKFLAFPRPKLVPVERFPMECA